MYRQVFPAPRGHTPAPYFVQGTTPVFSYTVTQQGTKAGLPLDYDLIYPLDFGTRVK